MMMVPAVDAAATLVRYYNAAAHGGFTGDTTPDDAATFCNTTKGGQSLCPYSTVCPKGAGNEIFGEPGCGENITGDEYFHVDASECPSGETFAYVEWNGTGLCELTCETDSGFASLNAEISEIVACCSSTADGHDTWSKVDGEDNEIGGCGGGKFSSDQVGLASCQKIQTSSSLVASFPSAYR